MPAACSPVGPMRKTMKRQMLYMQPWTKEWMKDEKKEGQEMTSGVKLFVFVLNYA